MKILWLTNTPSNASSEFGNNSAGGFWISSLERLVTEAKLCELGISFFYQGETYKKVTKNNVIYYGVPFRKTNAFNRVLSRHFNRLDDEVPFFFDQILNDFQPDLIHVFGTELGYGKILMHRHEKVLFNIQGLMSPIAELFFPLGITGRVTLIRSNFNSIIKGITPYHFFKIARRQAKREDNIIRFWKYFIGRTDWDRNYIRLLNPNATYFHCEEMLRKEFYDNKWTQPSDLINNDIVIGTTIFPYPYKGLDLIYKVMDLLQNYNVRWKIFGIDKDNDWIKIVRKNLRINIKIPNIEFCGLITTEELIKNLLSCHFFVHPSYIENSSNSVCEAMMLGMPVLASSIGGLTSIVKSGETGFLFNPYDKYDLAGRLVRLINNYEQAKQAGLKAREVAIKRHSPNEIINTLNKIYNFIYLQETH